MNADDVSTLVSALVDNAKRLGLTWTLRRATVDSVSPLRVIYDGDTVSIDVFALNALPYIGQRVTGIWVPPAGNFIICPSGGAHVFTEDLSAATQTSGSFGNGTGSLASAVFVAPPSRRVDIHWSAEISLSVVGTANASIQVNTGSEVDTGTTILPASVDNNARNGDSVVVRSSAFYQLIDLTAGDSYNVVMKYAVSGGTGTFNRRKILVVPN